MIISFRELYSKMICKEKDYVPIRGLGTLSTESRLFDVGKMRKCCRLSQLVSMAKFPVCLSEAVTDTRHEPGSARGAELVDFLALVICRTRLSHTNHRIRCNSKRVTDSWLVQIFTSEAANSTTSASRHFFILKLTARSWHLL